MGKTLRDLLLISCLLVGITGVACAQQAVPPPPPQAQQAASSNVVQSSKSMWSGLVITILACGAGIFVVAKSSTRN